MAARKAAVDEGRCMAGEERRDCKEEEEEEEEACRLTDGSREKPFSLPRKPRGGRSASPHKK